MVAYAGCTLCATSSLAAFPFPKEAVEPMNDELEILLVEDDPDTLANLIDILELDGHRIRVAESFAAIRQAGLHRETALVILDRRLPDGEAEVVLPELKQLLPNAEFIVVTGYADMENAITALRLGVADYILKPINADAIRKCVANIFRQRQTERELLSEQRFANQMLATAEAIILVLDLDGRIVRFNPYFTKITGWKLDELAGRDWFENCVFEKDRDRLRELFDSTAAGVQTTGVLNSVVTTDGRQRQIRWSNSTLKGDDGEVTSVLAIGADVTDLIEAQGVATRSQRLAAIGQTMAGLAHESRNALHRIMASVEILQLDIPPESDSRVEVDSIFRASRELANTLEEVRNFAAPIHLHRELVRLPEVWRRVWRDLASLRKGRNAELVELPNGCECPVDMDVLRLEQVFRNLFENALAACEDPVRIHVECQCDGPDAVLLDIQDNGPGLCGEQREKLFEPFFTTKPRGTGLGMSIVQRIIDAHGGNIQIVFPKRPESNPHGARFLIRLPMYQSANGYTCFQTRYAANV